MGYHADVHVDEDVLRQTLADDVRAGLGATPKTLPPKYFYDTAGSALFDEITRLPEYYLTRAEEALLRTRGPAIMAAVRPVEIVELGAGSATKIRWLIEALGDDQLARYIPLDVDEQTMAEAARQLLREAPALDIHGVVADFERHLDLVPTPIGRRLVVFLGSTIGNLEPEPRVRLLCQVAKLLDADDRFLVGVDLVKSRRRIEAAYNDRAGVTAEFNRNVLRVINRKLDGDFRPDAFRHRAFYDPDAARIEMHLAPETPQVAHLRKLGLSVRISAEETIRTELSYKFTRASVEAMLGDAGLALDAWHTDAESTFALALAARA